MSVGLERWWYPDDEKGPWRTVALAPLLVASGCYRLVVAARNAMYDRGLLAVRAVNGPRVVSVGNLNVGGAGKTPTVIFLAQRAAARGRRVAVLSRGYGRRARGDLEVTAQTTVDEAGDEPLLVSRLCAGVRVFVGADRARLAQRVADEGKTDLIILDDGFQHRRLARDVDIVVVDEAAGLGNGHLLPRGPLREPASELRRATLVWLRVASAPSRSVPPVQAPVVRAVHRLEALVDPSGQSVPLEALRGRPVVAVAGLARPGQFLRSLRDAGLAVVELCAFPDHHRFSPVELAAVAAAAKRQGAVIVTTQKDQTRLPGDFSVWTVGLGVTVLSGLETVDQALGLT